MPFAETAPVIQGAESIVHLEGQVGVLVQHGFTGTTQSIRPLAEALMKANYSVVAPRLAGHGTSPEDMERSTYQDWIESTESGYETLRAHCDKVFVVGLSMGGTLATHLAHNYPDTAGLVLINSVILSDHIKSQVESVPNPPRFFETIGSDIKKPDTRELGYDCTPVMSLHQLVSLINTVAPTLPSITCPTLIFASDDDHVVPPDNQTYYMTHLGSHDKRIIRLHDSYHVATLDNDAVHVIDGCLSFLVSN